MTLALAAPASPYKGLAAFEDSDLDALLFFGREREIEVIAANLIAARITVLYGPSGVGKSSVLCAGVAHRLRREQGAEVIVFSTWAGDPVAALIEAAGGSGDSLVDVLADASDRAGGDLYVVLDQFEECFLYHHDGGAFAAQLAQLLRRSGLRVNVLIGMREDSLARLDALKASIPNLLSNRLRLERLDRLAGAAAILGPIRRYNDLAAAEDQVEIEPQLEQAILDQVTAGRVEVTTAGRGIPLTARDENRIETPYLQLVLTRLWEVERSRRSGTLRLSTLRELGGAEHIVEDHLERAMAELTPREKGAAAAMYNFLVTPSGTKIAHGVRDLAGYASVDESEASEVLQRLTAERIVRASSTNGPSTTRYEIFHDVLADAVVAWRTRYDAEQALAAERVDHRRRQRRLLGIFVAALFAFAVMAAVAVYALAERGNARHQAAVAETQRATAQQAQKKEQAAAAKATSERIRADKARRAAVVSARAARRSAAVANVARLQALAEKARAEGNERKAEQFLAQAEAARRVAQGKTELALRAQALATRQKQVVRAQGLEADARAWLMEDPEQSVRRSLAAIHAYRVARIRRPVGVEDTLREGLVLMRLRAVLPGGGPVHVVRFTPAGDTVFVGGSRGARLYDRRNRFAVRRLLPAVDVADAAFSPDGTMVVVAGSGEGDHAAHVWDTRTGAEVLRLPHGGPVLSVAFSPDGRLIATGSADGTARLWTAAGGLPIASWSHQRGARGDDVISVSFSPDGRRLLTVGGNRFVRVFDLKSLSEAFPALNNVVLVNTAKFSHNGKWIATAGADEFVRLWNAETGAPGPVFQGTGHVTDLAFSPDDTLLATAGANDTIARVWNVAQGSASAIITIHRSGVQAVAFTRDGSSVITAGRDGKAYVLSANAGFVVATLAGHTAPLAGTTVSPDGELIATWSDDGTARLWDVPTGTTAREIWKHDAPPAGTTAPVVAFDPDGRHMLSAGSDGTVKLWGPGARVQTLHQVGAVNSAAFSRDGTRLVTGGEDGTARVWRVSDGRLLAVLRNGLPVNVARLTPDGRLAVTGDRNGFVRVWNVGTQEAVRDYRQDGAVNDAELSRDGGRVATADADGTAAVFGVTRRSESILRGHSDEVVAVAFSPNGKQVATASDDQTARIWNIQTGDFVQLPHDGGVTALVYSPDGALLATVSADASVRVWRARTGVQVALLQIHSGVVTDVAFSGDGRWLATAGPLSAGIWETRKKGVWPASPQWLVRGAAPPRLEHVAFSPRGWRLLTGWRSGSVRLYDCRLCGRVPQLSAIARARLREIVRAKP
jgi:WD40 repeat protein